MKTQDLKQFLTKVKKINKGNNTLPILDNLLLSDGKLLVTNLETTYFKRFEELTGTFLIPILFLDKIVTKIKTGEIDINTEGTIKTEKGNFNYSIHEDRKGNKIYTAEEYPDMTSGKYKAVGSFKAPTVEKLKKATFYAGNDDLRPVMSGVYVSPEDIAATDAHIMYFTENESKIKDTFIMCKDAVLIMEPEEHKVFSFIKSFKDGEGVSALLSNSIKMVTPKETIIFRAIDGKYPNYKAVIPKENNISIKVIKKDLLSILDLALLAANKWTKQIVFNIDKAVNIKTEDLDFNREYNGVLAAQEICGSIEIGFNIDYIKQAVKFAGDEVELKMSLPNRAGVINGEVLIMPVMLTKDN